MSFQPGLPGMGIAIVLPIHKRYQSRCAVGVLIVARQALQQLDNVQACCKLRGQKPSIHSLNSNQRARRARDKAQMA